MTELTSNQRKTMSQSAKFFRLVTSALKDEALKSDIPKVRDRTVAAILDVPASTFCEWHNDEKKHPQISCLLKMLDYLERPKIMEILKEILSDEKVSLKLALEGSLQAKKNKRKSPLGVKAKINLLPMPKNRKSVDR